jgi:multiple sugar transport system substrate-binding protein
MGTTRRAVIQGVGLSGTATVWLAACGTQGQPSTGGTSGPPAQIVWSKAQDGEPTDTNWKQLVTTATQATNVNITPVIDSGDFWTKRQTEYAAGTTTTDIMYNQLNWVLLGGLNGMFVDHYPLMKKDKVDLTQYYKIDLDSWGWKGKLWSIPYTSGGEVVHFNKKLFDAKGVKYPTKDWTYDDFTTICQKLTDPANNRYAVDVGQNVIQYVMGTFLRNFGGKIVNDTRDQALYGDDANALNGLQYDVDLFLKYKVTPPAEATKGLPSGFRAMEGQIAAMEINGVFRHTNVRAAIGAENLDFAPPPKGPKGIQQARVAGNAWSIMTLSKVQDAAWRVLHYLHTKEGMLSPAHLGSIAWPPLVWAGKDPKWLDIFKGTHIGDCQTVWQNGGHNLVLPEGSDAFSIMNDAPGRAIKGDISTRDALRESAQKANDLFSRRPAAWKV